MRRAIRSHGTAWLAPTLLVSAVLTSCAGVDAPPKGDTAEASLVLDGARRAVGWTGVGTSGSRGLLMDAAVSWQGPAYEVEIVSDNDGAIRMRFVDGVAFGVGRTGSWALLSPDSTSELSDTLETFARGHDFFMNMVRPETRLSDIRFAGVASFTGEEALLVTASDALGGRVSLYYSLADSLPLGYRVQDHATGNGLVTTTLGDWSPAGPVRLPGRVRFSQGSEVFEYVITGARVLDPVPDSMYEGRAGGEGGSP